MAENWKTVPGYDMYEVSDQGRVRSWKRHRGLPGRRREPRMLKPQSANSGGYPMVSLWKNAKPVSCYVHTLVLTLFVGVCPLGLECCHGDGNSANNRLSNLRWDTRSANNLDAMAHGTWKKPPLLDRRGEAHPSARLTEAQVIEIRRAYAAGGVTQAKLGAKFSVDPSTISDIIRGKRWAHVMVGA